MENNNLGQKIRSSRKALNLTQSELSERTNVPLMQISRYERNVNEPDFETIKRIADALDVPTTWLLGIKDEILSESNNLYKNPNPRYAPLLGTASAGTPENTDDFIDEMLEVPTFIKHKANYMFFIKVNGDSMNKLMPNGSVALILKSEHFTKQPVSGDIVVFKVDNEFCIKRFIETDTVVIFEPSSYSDEFKPLVYVKGSNIDIEIIGKVIYTYNIWE